jgi:hypothetical protein
MMSLTIKYHNGKAPSALQAAESWASRLEATQSPNNNSSELKGPYLTPPFARIPEKCK